MGQRWRGQDDWKGEYPWPGLPDADVKGAHAPGSARIPRPPPEPPLDRHKDSDSHKAKSQTPLEGSDKSKPCSRSQSRAAPCSASVDDQAASGSVHTSLAEEQRGAGDALLWLDIKCKKRAWTRVHPYYPYPEDLMEHDWHDLLARRHENIIISIIIPIIINSRKIQ